MLVLLIPGAFVIVQSCCPITLGSVTLRETVEEVRDGLWWTDHEVINEATKRDKPSLVRDSR